MNQLTCCRTDVAAAVQRPFTSRLLLDRIVSEITDRMFAARTNSGNLQ